MNPVVKNTCLFALVAVLIVLTGLMQSWNTALLILNMGLISAIMALGVNLQWGFAGLFNVGVMGFVALGGLATVLVAMPPTPEAWSAGGAQVLAGLACGAAVIIAAAIILEENAQIANCARLWCWSLLIGGFFVYRCGV